jgi:pimeloyl-ACP methyl ester carboxylesterase
VGGSVWKRFERTAGPWTANIGTVSETRTLSTGAELRVTHGLRPRMVVCVNGGQRNEVPGTWSASLEWLVAKLAPRFPELGFAEVKYRIKSWQQLDLCIADARAALGEAGGEQALLVGFSMGGAVAIASADEPNVDAVLGLAPWVPDRLDVSAIAGKRFDVLHGSLDRYLPGIPGVSPTTSRRGFDRIQTLGVPGTYTLITGAVHGLALRSPGGRLLPLPRARTWVRDVSRQIGVFAG